MECISKIVYEDEGKSKVIRGTIVKEDEFVYDVKTTTGQVITIGKRAIVQIIREVMR